VFGSKQVAVKPGRTWDRVELEINKNLSARSEHGEVRVTSQLKRHRVKRKKTREVEVFSEEKERAERRKERLKGGKGFPSKGGEGNEFSLNRTC